MAHQTEKEETNFKVPETITPCTTTSSSTTASAAAAISQPSRISDNTTTVRSTTTSRSPKRSYPSDEEQDSTQTDQTKPHETTPFQAKRVVNRCSGCRRKVGLTGFRCRCGQLFCAEHRYSDRHDCSYDYKAAGREAIARENPVVKAAKIVKV